jgi:hypothetical protein
MGNGGVITEVRRRDKSHCAICFQKLRVRISKEYSGEVSATGSDRASIELPAREFVSLFVGQLLLLILAQLTASIIHVSTRECHLHRLPEPEVARHVDSTTLGERVVVGMILCVRRSTQGLRNERTVLVGLAFLFKLFASFVRCVEECAQIVSDPPPCVSEKWKIRRNTGRLVIARISSICSCRHRPPRNLLARCGQTSDAWLPILV